MKKKPLEKCHISTNQDVISLMYTKKAVTIKPIQIQLYNTQAVLVIWKPNMNRSKNA